MTPAIRFPHDTTLAVATEVLRGLECVVADLGGPGDKPDISRIIRRTLQPALGLATISHEACVISMSTPDSAPLPGDRWMREWRFETGTISALRLIASAARDLAARIVPSIRERRPGVPTHLTDDLGAAAAIGRARMVWTTRSPDDTIGICPETPWSPAAWIADGATRGDPVPNDIAAMLVPLVEVRLVRTGTRSTAKIRALPIIVGPMDPVMRLRAIAEATDGDAA